MTTSSIDHDDLGRQAAAYALGALAAERGAAFEAHLSSCADCAAELESLWPIVQALTDLAPPVDPPPALRDRLLASLASPARMPDADRHR